jgi:hypothetical protein
MSRKSLLTIATLAAVALLSGCAEKKSCGTPAKVTAPAPAPVVEAPAPAPVVEAPAPVVEAEPAPIVEEMEPVIDEKTRAVQ